MGVTATQTQESLVGVPFRAVSEAVRFQGLVAHPFVGREAALAQLSGAFERARQGFGGAVFVAGEPGIGKTRLVERFADHARDAGACVTWATSREADGAPAFWPWVQVIRSCMEGACACDLDTTLGPRIADAVRLVEAPVPGDLPAGEQARFRLFDSMATLLTHTCTASPMVVVLDDLHWADPSSLHFLNFLVPELRAARLLVIGTFRDLEVDASTETGRLLVDATRTTSRLDLSGLGRDEVDSLLTATTGAPQTPELVAAVLERSGGNPLFVAELGRLLVARGDGGTAMSIPAGIAALLDRRLARVSQPCHELLTVAAVIGEDFGLEEVRRVARIETTDALALADEAIRARLVTPTEEARARFRFSHALVRDRLYEALALGRRVELHDRAAAVLEELGAAYDDRAAQLALHAVRAAPGGNVARAVDACEAAGARARQRLAYEQAVHHLHQALEALDLGSPDPDRRTALLLALGEALLSAGDLPDARLAFGEAAALARSRRRPDALAQAALGFGAGLAGFEVSLFDDAQLELIEEALAELPDDEIGLRARLLARLSVALSFRESIENRLAVSEEAVALAREAGDPVVLAQALCAQCDAIAGPDFVEHRLATAGEAVALAVSAKDPAAELLARRLRLVALLELGDVVGADAEIEAFARTADHLAQPIYSWYVPLWRGYLALGEGRLEEAAGRSNEAEVIGARAHSTNAVMLVATQRYGIAFHLRDYAGGYRLMRPEYHRIQEMGTQAQLFPAMVGSFAGDVELWNRLDRRGLIESVPRDSEWLELLVVLGRAAITMEDADLAEWIYGELHPYAGLFAVDGIGAAPWGSVSLALGRLAGFLGRADEARSHLEHAVSAHRQRGMGLFLAESLAELGRLQGDRALLAEAAALCRELGLDNDRGPLDATVAPADTPPAAEFRHDGDVWVLGFGGQRVQVRDRKGLHDLATLLAAPKKEVAAVDLAGVSGGSDASEGLHAPGHAGEVLDAQARRDYEARIRELQEEADDAEADRDFERAAKAEAEMDALLGQLAGAVGLGGRGRKAGHPAERARTAVAWRIKSAIDHIEKVHPTLGGHLRRSVRTGAFCAYDPEDAPDWSL